MSSTTAETTSVLPALYASGNHSDLIVRACDGREFRVHKCIVSSKSGFFEGACRGGFKEAQAGVVEVEEDGEVMDALFRHIYENPLEWAPLAADSFEILRSKATTETFGLARKLRAASDKYLVTGLKRPTELAMVNRLGRLPIEENVAFTKLYIACFSHDADVGILVRHSALSNMCLRFKRVLEDAEAWSLLGPLTELVQLTVICAIQRSEYDAIAEGTAAKNLKGLAVSKTYRRYADLDRVWPVPEAVFQEAISSFNAIRDELTRVEYN